LGGFGGVGGGVWAALGIQQTSGGAHSTRRRRGCGGNAEKTERKRYTRGLRGRRVARGRADLAERSQFGGAGRGPGRASGYGRGGPGWRADLTKRSQFGGGGGRLGRAGGYGRGGPGWRADLTERSQLGGASRWPGRAGGHRRWGRGRARGTEICGTKPFWRVLSGRAGVVPVSRYTTGVDFTLKLRPLTY